MGFGMLQSWWAYLNNSRQELHIEKDDQFRNMNILGDKAKIYLANKSGKIQEAKLKVKLNCLQDAEIWASVLQFNMPINMSIIVECA